MENVRIEAYSLHFGCAGLDKIEVQDEQEMWASCSGDTWQVHTVSNPSTMLPVLGHMNSGWLFSDLEEVVDADGTPGVKVPSLYSLCRSPLFRQDPFHRLLPISTLFPSACLSCAHARPCCAGAKRKVLLVLVRGLSVYVRR